jgi:hypothetical protein
VAELLEFPEPKKATRISVASKGDGYVVRVDGQRPVSVYVRGGDVHCECGSRRCAHIKSLLDCGFIGGEIERHNSGGAIAA